MVAPVNPSPTGEEGQPQVGGGGPSPAGAGAPVQAHSPSLEAAQGRTLAITGGTGFVGQHLLRMALAAGDEVRALTRASKLPQDEIAWIDGSLDRPDSLLKLAEGADAIVHVAGLISGGRAAFEAVNVGGTAAMIDAARSAGVRRFIHISSLAAREPELSAYGWSKAGSERLVRASGLQWTIIRPPAVYGPGDRETLELFKMAKRGFVALPPGGRFSLLHVEDLCRLILATIEQPDTVAQVYEPDDGRDNGWEHRHFARSLGRIFGKRAAAVSMPKPVLAVASGIERLFRGDKAKLTSDRVRYFCHPDWVASAERRPPAQIWRPEIRTPSGLRATADWYRAEGWL